jgi:hypothetical protein
VAAYTRRHFVNFLQTGAATAVAGFRPVGVEAAVASGESVPRFSRRHFEPLIGSEFRVASDGGRFSLTLIAVEDMSGRPNAIACARKVDCALLRFTAGGSVLADGIYRLAHERNGEYDLYLSPGKPGRYLAYLCR